VGEVLVCVREKERKGYLVAPAVPAVLGFKTESPDFGSSFLFRELLAVGW
jgi:hypothetical protein